MKFTPNPLPLDPLKWSLHAGFIKSKPVLNLSAGSPLGEIGAERRE
jgi:hypothetical protein